MKDKNLPFTWISWPGVSPTKTTTVFRINPLFFRVCNTMPTAWSTQWIDWKCLSLFLLNTFFWQSGQWIYSWEILFVLSSILALDYLTFESSFKLSVLTLTNTASSALYGMQDLSFSDLHNFTKMSLILFMVLAKVELIALIYLFKKFIFRE